jgi:hypothetical protein
MMSFLESDSLLREIERSLEKDQRDEDMDLEGFI